MTRHVERIDTVTGTDVLLIMGLVGMFTFLPVLLVVVVNAVRDGVTHHWREIVVLLGCGLIWPTLFAVAALLGNRDGDREQISLIIDEDGVYLGGRRPRRIAWADVAEVALITERVPPVRAGHSPSVHRYAAFRLRDAKPRKKLVRWRPRKACRNDESLRSIESAVRRLTPDVPVTVTRIG